MTLIASNAGVERMTTWDEGGGGGGGVGGVGSEGDNLTIWKETTGVNGGIVGVNGVDASKGNSDHQIPHFTSAITPPITSNGLIVRSGKGLPREEEVEEEEGEEEEEEGEEVKTKTVAAVVAKFIRREEAGALERHGKGSSKCNGRAGLTKSRSSEENGKEKEAVVLLDQNHQSHSHKNGGLAPVSRSCSKESEEPSHLDTAAPKHGSPIRLHDVQGVRGGGGGRLVNEDGPAPNRNHKVEESSVVQVASTTVRSSFSSSSPSSLFTSTYSYPCSTSSPSPPSPLFPPQPPSTIQYVSNLLGNVTQGEDKEQLETSKASSNQKVTDEPPVVTLSGSNGDPNQRAEANVREDGGLGTNDSRENGDAKMGDVGESARGKKVPMDGVVASGTSAARTVTTAATSKTRILVEQRTWSSRVASDGIAAGSGPNAVRICNEILTATCNRGTSSPAGNSTAPHLPTAAAPTAKVNPTRGLGEDDETETQCKGTTTGKRESSQKNDRTSEVERRALQDSPQGWADREGYAACLGLGSEHSREHPKGDRKGHDHEEVEKEEVTDDRPPKEGEMNVKGSEAIVIGSKDKRDAEERVAASPAGCQSSCKPYRCPEDYCGEEKEEYCVDNKRVVEAVVRPSGVDNDEDSAVMSVVEKEDKGNVRSQRGESVESLDQQKRAGKDPGESGRSKSGSEPCVGDKHHKADCDTDQVRDGKEILSSDVLSGKELRVKRHRENGHVVGLALHDHPVGGEVEEDPSRVEENVKLGFEGEPDATRGCDVTEARDVGDEGNPCAISVTHRQTVEGGLPPLLPHSLHTRLPQALTPPPSPPPPLPSSPPPFATPPHQSPPSESPDVPSYSSVPTTLHLPQQSGREDVEPDAVVVFVAEIPEPDRPVTTTTTTTTNTCCVLTPPSPGSREDVISAAETLECGFKRLSTGFADDDTAAATETRTVTLPAPECAAGQGEATATASRSSASPPPPSSGAAEATHEGAAAESGANAQVAKAATSTEVSDSQGAVEAALGLAINILPHSFSSHVRAGLDEIATYSPTEADDVKEDEEDNKNQLGRHLSGLNGNDREGVEKSPMLYKELCEKQQKDHLHQRLPSCRPLSDEEDGGHGDVAVLRLPKEDVELRSHVDEIVIDAAHPPPRFDSALATCHEDPKAMASYHDHPLLCQSPEGVPGPSQVVVVAAAATVASNGHSSKVQQKLCQSFLGTRPAIFDGGKSAPGAPEVDSDYEYEAAQKEKLQTACKDIAAALSVLLPSAGNGGEEATTKTTMTAASTKAAAPSRAQAAHSSGSRVGKEGDVPSVGTNGVRRGSKRRRKKSQGSRQCRKCHGRECLTARKCSVKRGSFYDNCSSDHSECEVAQASKGDTSAVRVLCGKGAARRRATTGECDVRNDIMLSNDSGVATAEKESYARRGFGTKECTSSSSPPPSPCSSLAPTSPSASGSSSEDDDDDEDYCQTEDCGEDCDYCSADGVEDEDDPCGMCHKNRESPARICKHSGVITNGILKCYRKRLQDPAEISRVTGHRPFALQSVVRRRRPGRRGLVAIRESSITSDEHPEETEEEEEEEDDESFDGSNCDLSSSWRFALHRMSGSDSRDSTLRRKQRSFEGHAQEKCNSLPSASSRSLNKDQGRRTGEGLSRQVSTSDDELANMCSKNSLPRTNAIPPRPPRNPRTRPPAVPSPSGTAIRTLNVPPSSPNTPRPALGLQGLNRSPATSRSSRLPSPALPLSPRSISPRSPSNPNPPFGFPPTSVGILPSPGSPSLASSRQRLTVEGVSSGGLQLQPPASPNLSCRLSSCSASSSRGVGGGGGGCGGGGGSGTELETHPSDSPRVCSRSGVLVSRNFSISDDECGWRNSVDRRHVTITRHESVYREVAEMGYHLTPDSPVDPYWLTWKLGVLQKTVEEVGGRLEEAEKTVAAWGTVPQDPNLADQHVHNVKKFREGLADLQRGVDDVNDQAARFSAHNVPLTPANSARLHDLNNRWKTLETTVNDRWRQLAGRSREVTPMTPAQLASSVAPPWERATASNKVPYYINHDRESTHWDHPDMMELLDSMAQYNHIKFSAYRTAMKLRTLQKKLALEYAKLQTATGIFDEHGLRGQNDRLIDVNDMVVVLSALYASIASDHPEVNTTLAMDLCLNWLLNVYDSQRTGQMRVLSFKVGLVCLCTGHLEEKYRYMFRLIADLNRLVDQRKLGLLLHDCVQVPRQLGEVAAFGGSNIEPSVRSCFTKAGKDRETIEAVHFLSWVQQEPQSLVWLAVLHRVAASENVHHQVKCNICKAYPVVGLRYRCLKCLSFDMCQQCFFGGRSNKSHKVTHPMHEYCTATTTGEDMKDFTKALKNKFKSKRSLQKHAKKGYLPVQTVLEGDALESPAPSPQHNVSSQDMHTRLEMYASRLAEVELRTNSNSTPDSEDEHGLIAQYCQSLSSSDAPLPVPRSPLQIMAAVDAEQKEELEAMIRDLEEENKVLQAEYDRLKAQKPVGSPPEDFGPQGRSETDMIAEAKLLREHKGRLEARMSILEEHNRQLEAQLHRLRQLLEEPSGASSPNKSGTLQTKSVTASQLAMDSPAKVNGHSTAQGGSGGPYEGLEQMSEYVRPPPPPLGSMSHVGNLFSRAGDLGKAVGTLVATMTDEGEKDSRSSHHSTEDSE